MMNDDKQFLGIYLLPWFYFCDVQISFKFTRYKVEWSYIFMENSDEQKLAATNRFIDMNVGRKGILGSRSQVVFEKESASTSLTKSFVNSLQPCILALTKPLPITRSANTYANCRRHGFASCFSLREIENSEFYTRVVIHSPRPKIIHRYMECELELYDTNNGHNSEEVVFLHLKALRDGYLVCTQDRCKLCNKNLTGKNIFMQRDSKFCSNECRSNDNILSSEEVKDPYAYMEEGASRVPLWRLPIISLSILLKNYLFCYVS